MRVPNAGQPLYERRIVREGKLIAQAMLADFADRPALSIRGLARELPASARRLANALRRLSLRA